MARGARITSSIRGARLASIRRGTLDHGTRGAGMGRRCELRGARAWGRGWCAISRMPGGADHETRRTLRGFGCDCDRRRAMKRGPRGAVRLTKRAGGGAGHVSLFKKTQKSPHVAGLIGRSDRLSVSVPVALNSDCHMGDVCHCAIVEVQYRAI